MFTLVIHISTIILMYKILIPSFILQFLSARRVDQTAHVEIEDFLTFNMASSTSS
jgi:hypothetical protein